MYVSSAALGVFFVCDVGGPWCVVALCVSAICVSFSVGFARVESVVLPVCSVLWFTVVFFTSSWR